MYSYCACREGMEDVLISEDEEDSNKVNISAVTTPP
jgi:hypothetical protein